MASVSIEQEHYVATQKIVSTVSRLPPSNERVQFSRLLSAIDLAFTKYSSACVDARVRPSIKNQQIAEDALAEYLRLRTDIELSLTLAALFIG